MLFRCSPWSEIIHNNLLQFPAVLFLLTYAEYKWCNISLMIHLPEEDISTRRWICFRSFDRKCNFCLLFCVCFPPSVLPFPVVWPANTDTTVVLPRHKFLLNTIKDSLDHLGGASFPLFSSSRQGLIS